MRYKELTFSIEERSPNSNLKKFAWLKKYTRLKRTWLILFFTIFTLNLWAQKQIHFSQLTQSFTNCILKDSDGFIWVGTQDGLLRYDNFEFKVFRYSSQDEYSLPNNYVKAIVEDKNQNLWLGTFGGGLVRWDRTLERFTSFPINTSSESINSLEIFRDSILLIGSENGLIQFNINSKAITKLYEEEDDRLNFINDVYVSDEDIIFLGTNAGFLQYSSKNKITRKLLDKPNLIVYRIEGKAHRIYLCTNQGLYIYNKRKSIFENQVPEKNVSSILLTNNDEWFLGTNTGVGHYSEDYGYEWYTASDDRQSGLKSDLIHTLYNLDGDMIWIGTRKGVHQFSIRPPDFKSLQKIYNNTACSKTTLGMVEDKNMDIWICSRDGLMHIDIGKNSDDWTGYCHKPENTPDMLDSYTINITEDMDKSLWLAYRTKGFSRLKEVNGKWEWQNFPKIMDQLGGDGVNQVFQDLSGDYWLATRGKGLIKFDPNTEELKFYTVDNGLSHPYIFRLDQKNKGELLVSTANGGLCKFDISSESFDCYQLDPKNPSSISANMVLSTNTRSDGQLLVCTTEGLNILDENKAFAKVNTFDGLLNNVVYAALEDDNGKIWVSTNEGISKLDLSKGSPNVTNYNLSHGLASYEFNQHSYLEHSSGIFLFGGIDGVTVFDPINIKNTKISPKLALIDFQLFNKSVPIAEENGSDYTLPKSINEIDAISLDYNQNSVGIEYAALGITNADNISYQYKLEGMEEEWVKTDDRNYAPYPKLPFGDYKFKVRLTDLNDNVITEEKSIKISIAPPPWRTWWAYLFYVISIVGIMYLIIRSQKSRTLAIARARENERDVFRKKMARDFHDEAGNKITRISLITDTLARKSKNTDQQKSLHKLQDNIQDLRLGMTDFIWVLDPGKDSLSATLRRFMDFANETFEYSDIDFKMDAIEAHLEEVVMPSNIRRHFLLIMKESITNIIKHANPKNVKFTFSNNNNQWKFNISDDGNGFDVASLKRVNGLNNMKSRAEKINGTMDIISEIGKGSTMSLNILL